MNVGFIGTGSMGSILIESLIRSGALQPEQIIAANRTIGKVLRLAETCPGLRIARSNIEVVLEAELLFICVKPLEYKKVLDEIRKVTLPDQIIVSITSPIQIQHLEEQLNCKIAKVIPSITNYMLSGATLCMYGERMEETDKQKLELLLGAISETIRISEKHTRVTSDISSCGPAFFALLVQKFVEAAVVETGIPYEEATRLASHMLLGTGKLLTEGQFTPDALQKRVAVPGGITAEGLQLMEHELDGMFNRLIRITHAKYHEDLEKVGVMFLRTID
ncbi:MAG: competence protein [Paenibacillaceae bacterium]|nr:competence protein [Paenibacillaceae bacterium]